MYQILGKVYAVKAAAPLVCGSQKAVPIIIMSGNHKNIPQILQMRWATYYVYLNYTRLVDRDIQFHQLHETYEV